MKVNIERIDNNTYSFRMSNKDGIRMVAKVLTFPNPNPISKNRNVEFFDKKKLTFGLGMITTVVSFLNKRKIKFNLSDYKYSPVSIDIDDRMSGNYIHQREAVEAFYRRRFGIIVVPTRGGKTFIASEIIRLFLKTERGQFLFCVDNITLFTQAVNDIKEYFEPYGGIEIGEIKAGSVDTSNRVTVAMIQTIQRTLSKSCRDKKKKQDLQNFLKGLQFLCVDEIHENCSANKLKIYKKCVNLDYKLCLSATPYRSDAKMENWKLQEWSGDIIYQISEKTLRERGVLSEYCVFELLVDHNDIPYDVDLDDCDYMELRRQLIFNCDVRNKHIIRIVGILQKLKLKTLLLFQSVEHGKFISSISGLPFISGEDTLETREARKKELLEQKEGGILLASDIFKKGVTLPDVEVLLVCDNNKESAITIQRKGRVLGATKNKTRSLVIDFIDIYDAYFSSHSESRLNTYVEAVGEDKVGILDTTADDCFQVLERWIKKWFSYERNS